jgi:hypothetical protein
MGYDSNIATTTPVAISHVSTYKTLGRFSHQCEHFTLFSSILVAPSLQAAIPLPAPILRPPVAAPLQ